MLVLMQKQLSVLNLSNYLNQQKHISTFQITSTNKNKSLKHYWLFQPKMTGILLSSPVSCW